MSASILVTGARGFTGRHFLSMAEARGYRAFPLESDLTDRAAITKELQGRSFDYVVHLGAISFVGHGDLAAFYGVNVIGTQNLLDSLLSSSARPKKVLIASSANVYGNSQKGVISEVEVPLPVNHYANSKLAMEYMARTYFEKLPMLLVRPFNYTGEGQDSRFVIPKIVEHFRAQASVVELGNTDVVREYNDVRFVCDMYIKLLECDVISDVINVCTSMGYTLSDVIAALSELTGHQIQMTVNPDFVRPNEIKKLLGDNSKLVEAVGQAKEYSLTDTLKVMLEEQ